MPAILRGLSVRPLVVALLAAATLASVPATGAVAADDSCDTAFDTTGGALHPPPAANATVSGHLDAEPGTTVTVVLRFTDGDTLRNRTTVDEHGSFAATFDLAGRENGTFVASLRRDGEVIDAVEGRVGVPRASVALRNQTAGEPAPHDDDAEATVTVARTSMERGGFLAIHRGSPRGPILGVSDYLPPGIHENVTIGMVNAPTGARTMVVMPHLDTDCDRRFDWVLNDRDDWPYETNRTDPPVVYDGATVSFPTATPSPTPTPDRTATYSWRSTPTPTPTAPPTVTETPMTEVPTTSKPTAAAGTTTPAPGFAFAAAAAALLVAASVVARRR